MGSKISCISTVREGEKKTIHIHSIEIYLYCERGPEKCYRVDPSQLYVYCKWGREENIIIAHLSYLLVQSRRGRGTSSICLHRRRRGHEEFIHMHSMRLYNRRRGPEEVVHMHSIRFHRSRPGREQIIHLHSFRLRSYRRRRRGIGVTLK